jgi:hypothetical protein
VRILLALYYYRPYISGLTIYVERLAGALARRGHIVTVLTSRYEASLPAEESADGVRVVRVPVALRISKGVVMPSLGRAAAALLREHDVLSVHLPNVDAPGLTLRAHRQRRPAVPTYHCDLTLPAGRFNCLVERGVFLAHAAACRLADRVVVYTEDYAAHSPLLSRFPEKLVPILPPVAMPAPTRTSWASGRIASACAARSRRSAPTGSSWARWPSAICRPSTAPPGPSWCPASMPPRGSPWCRWRACCAGRRRWSATCPACASLCA